VSDLKDGTYRLRCEVEKYITLEREFTVRGGAYSQVDVVLNAAPPPPPPPPAPAPAPARAIPSGGRSTSLSIVDFLDKNLIGGREPLKESVLACNPLETVRLLQMRERVAPHVHDRNDEVLYVVAGEGTIVVGEEPARVRAGSLVVVANGTTHAFERSGKNPLILVSTLVGAACDHADTAR